MFFRRLNRLINHINRQIKLFDHGSTCPSQNRKIKYGFDYFLIFEPGKQGISSYIHLPISSYFFVGWFGSFSLAHRSHQPLLGFRITSQSFFHSKYFR